MNIERIAALLASGEYEMLEFKETARVAPGSRHEHVRLPEPAREQALFLVAQSGVVTGQQVSKRIIKELKRDIFDMPAESPERHSE